MPDRTAGEAVWENLEYFLRRLRALPSCRSLDLPGGFCLSTGSASASDNWAFLPGLPSGSPSDSPSETGAGAVDSALRFFERLGLPFVWPLGGDAAPTAELLRRKGLWEAGRLLAMSRGLRGGAGRASSVAFCDASGTPERWARAAWLGFGGEGDAPQSLLDMAAGMARDPSLKMATARAGGEDVGTFLLAFSGSAVGVYYFAVLPSFRRQGVAAAMMDEADRIAGNAGGGRIVLQATPAGVPFYRSAGFEAHFEIPLFSMTGDVF